VKLWRCTHAACEVLPEDWRDVQRENEHAMRVACRKHVEEALGPDEGARSFTVHSASSGLGEKSGNGLHLSKSAPRGTLLTLYPGPIYRPLSGRIALMYGSLRGTLAEFDSVLCLSDSYVIKGIHKASGVHWHGAAANHPPDGVEPNAMFVTLNLDEDDMGADVAGKLAEQNWYASPPTTFRPRRRMRTAAIVLLRDAVDEELFVDYGFASINSGGGSRDDEQLEAEESSNQLPSWYHATHTSSAEEKRTSMDSTRGRQGPLGPLGP
jgi:hypothetical protein